MPGAYPSLEPLGTEDRQQVESWLVEFDKSWHKHLLAGRVGELPDSGDPLRLPALCELVKIDLERQWQAGHQITLETYLRDYPELGSGDAIPVDLVHAEYEVRLQFGGSTDLGDFRNRFPQQADQLEALVEMTCQSDPSHVASHSTDDTHPTAHAEHSTEKIAATGEGIPTRFGRYQVIALLGKGGMGEVYRAEDSQLGREVAIKILPASFAQDRDWLSRFEREAQAVAILSHPNILAIHDFGTDRGIRYAVMELLEGETLRSRLSRSAVPWREALKIGVAIADGIAAAHRKDIVHRDLKPENIFLTCDGQTKILDFGLARLERGPLLQRADDATPHTDTDAGTLMGTVGYMAPEQARGQSADTRSDVFAFGCLLYEMLTGRRAFAAKTVEEAVAVIVEQTPPVLSYGTGGIPTELQQVVQRCLETDPDQRFASGIELAEKLDTLAAKLTTPGTSLVHSNRNWVIGALLAAILFIGLMSVYSYFGPPKPTSPEPAYTHIVVDDSIAVLPLVSDRDESETELLSISVTEAIINRLARIPTLRVIARESAFRYKDQGVSRSQIGSELMVRYMLSGEIAKHDDNLLVRVELVDIRLNAQLWGEQYERSRSDVFAIHEDIADQVGRALDRASSDDRGVRLQSDNFDANMAYQMGRFQWNKKYGGNLTEALTHFQEAIKQDPDFALAHAGLADTYNVLGVYGRLSPDEAYRLGMQAADKALELSEGRLSEAHTAKAQCTSLFAWKEQRQKAWEDSLHHFQMAIQLKPSDGTARRWYASTLALMGRFDEAIEQAKQAVAVDPISPHTYSSLGWVYYLARRYDEAQRQLDTVVAMDPAFMVAHLHLAIVHLARGTPEEALVELEQVHKIAGGPSLTGLVCRGHAEAGNTEEARRLLDQLKELSTEQHVSPMEFVAAYIGLGEFDKALDWLETSFDQGVWQLGLVKTSAEYDPLRDHPRFVALQQRVGFGP